MQCTLREKLKKKGTFESNEKFIDVRVGVKRKITYARR